MSDAKAQPRGPQDRPMSPHLQVWRWHVTMATSILHRATGMALYVGALILAGWVVALASGPDAFDAYRALLGSPIGLVVLFGLTVSFLYHLANGVRHLVWDSGKGFEPKTADMTGWAAIAFGVVAAVLIWIIAFLSMGAAQ
ncbi:MAG: succinate dehydrogenase, cytochrome b556 subunit [Caulobacteraceae bacterium]